MSSASVAVTEIFLLQPMYVFFEVQTILVKRILSLFHGWLNLLAELSHNPKPLRIKILCPICKLKKEVASRLIYWQKFTTVIAAFVVLRLHNDDPAIKLSSVLARRAFLR